ncbi:hypothetical protein JCM19274_3007 [Algibacter lectus]|uniref:Uncharacterized protein n=1 Tax=Algibacter lectus TaxID=221126 RepID=A0A090WR59_9FLAO|nr:hypothetical protein JCM19274_3007 [Algibacter lectus]
MSSLYTSRVFINELFPDRDLVQGGQNSVIYTLDLAYYPQERGPYNYDPAAADGIDSVEARDSWQVLHAN